MPRKINISHIDKGDLPVLFATAIAYKSMELNDFLDVSQIDVWNRYINQAHMLIDFLRSANVITDTVQCVECNADYPTKAGADACARQDKVDHDAVMEHIIGGDSE